MLRTCDRVSVLVAGALLCTGTPAEITADERVVEAYLGADEPQAEAELAGALE